MIKEIKIIFETSLDIAAKSTNWFGLVSTFEPRSIITISGE